jgi:hypothetical protein
MSIAANHRISNVYLTSNVINAESLYGKPGRDSAAGTPSSPLSVPAAEIAPCEALLNRVAGEPERGVSSLNGYLWAGDGI